MNYSVYKLLEDWIDKPKLDWGRLSQNPNAIELLTANKDKINWDNLSQNPNAIQLLTANKDKINWEPLAEEIVAKALHPKRIERLMRDYNFDFEDWFD
jgi:hypothetical protein